MSGFFLRKGQSLSKQIANRIDPPVRELNKQAKADMAKIEEIYTSRGFKKRRQDWGQADLQLRLCDPFWCMTFWREPGQQHTVCYDPSLRQVNVLDWREEFPVMKINDLQTHNVTYAGRDNKCGTG